MAHNSHSSTPAAVPAEILAQHRSTWHGFTRLMLWTAIATAGVLVFLLLIGKVF